MTATTPGRHREPGDDKTIGRRRFLVYLVAAPTLTVAARLGIDTATAGAAPKGSARGGTEGPTSPTASNLGDATYVLTVTSDNRIIYDSVKVELGQGISTTVGMLVADELDARIADVQVRLADASGAGNQSVGGSGATRDEWKASRTLAAQARARLVTAAAQRWNLNASTLTTRDSAVWAPDGRSATYGDLAADAAKVTSPSASLTALKTTHELIGTATTQLSARDIVTGKMPFAMDITVPGALPTIVLRSDKLNQKVVTVSNAGTVLAMPGVQAVTTLPNGVAVSAATFHQAMQGRDALSVVWGPSPVEGISDIDVSTRLNAAAVPLAPISALSSSVDGLFEFAFVNHAPMETNDAVASVNPDGSAAEVWIATQGANGLRTAVATTLGLQESAVTVHTTRGGGSFGRRSYCEPAIEAALVSKAIGKPVKLMWTRTDDMRHGRMRPASLHRMRVAYTNDPLTGTLKFLSFQNQSSAVTLDLVGAVHPYLSILDPAIGGTPTLGTAFFALTQVNPYALGTEVKELNDVPLHIPTGFWRSVYSGHNRAAEEMMFDLLAKKLGKDPLVLRQTLAKTAAAKALLTKLESVSGWGTALPAGHGRGVGYHEEYNSRAGCVVEIDATNPDAPRVTKAVVVADVGVPVNPSGLKSEFMGCVMDGISTILRAGNHIDNGAMRETSFADFKWARQRHAPLQFDLHLMPATGSIGGAGELVVPAAAGAVGNAYARATGSTPSKFPING